MAVPKFMLVLDDVAVIKQVAALNPFPSYSYRGVSWGRSLFTAVAKAMLATVEHGPAKGKGGGQTQLYPLASSMAGTGF